MAIFSSPETAQSISAAPLPEVIETRPDIKFRGVDCRSITVTLENSAVYKNSNDEQITRRMQKIYAVESNNIQGISIEVKLELSKVTLDKPDQVQIIFGLDTVFRLTVDPHLRIRAITQDTPLTVDSFFKSGSAEPKTEDPRWYETYNLTLRNQKTYPSGNRYDKTLSDKPEDHLANNLHLIEFKKNATAWSFLTISSLLTDLLQNCPPLFLSLWIVGNYQFTDMEKAIDASGHKFEPVPTGFLPATGATAEQVSRDKEAKWDQFLMERANSMKRFIFRDLDLPIVTAPAVKISPNTNATGETVLPEDWNSVADLFQKPDESVDTEKLKTLNLKKGSFPAGSIFLWIILSLQDTELKFTTDSSKVYPTVNDGTDWKKISEDNLKKINKLRQDLSFLVPGSTNNDFTTNLTGVLLRVEGYTDRFASLTSNQTLSENRASSVIDELTQPSKALPAGVSDPIGIDKFMPQTGIGYGENRLKIQTPDGKREPRNRRVLIRILKAFCSP